MELAEYVVNANILFSAVLKQKGLYEELAERFVFYTPDFALLELQKYRRLILQKTATDPARLRTFTTQFFRKVTVMPDYIISEEALKTAAQLCADIDPKDVMYVALNEELQTTLLTRDKPLYDGLKAKGYERVKLFDEFVREQFA